MAKKIVIDQEVFDHNIAFFFANVQLAQQEIFKDMLADLSDSLIDERKLTKVDYIKVVMNSKNEQEAFEKRHPDVEEHIKKFSSRMQKSRDKSEEETVKAQLDEAMSDENLPDEFKEIAARGKEAGERLFGVDGLANIEEAIKKSIADAMLKNKNGKKV